MSRNLHLSIRWRLTWASLLVSAITLTIAGGTFFFYSTINQRRAEIKELGVRADHMAEALGRPLEEEDPQQAIRLLQHLIRGERIRHVRLTDANGDLFVEYTPTPGVETRAKPALRFLEPLKFRRPLDISRRILRNGQVIGWLGMSCQPAYVQRGTYDYLSITAVIFLLSMLSSLLLSLILRRHISQPIRELTRAAQSVSLGEDYQLDMRLTGRDELGQLVESFNRMLGQIHQREEELKRHRGHLEELVDQRAAVIKHTNEELRKEIWERKRAQGALIRLNEELEDRINERTQALLDNVLELRKVSEALERERNLFTDGPVVVFKWRAEEHWPIEYVSSNIDAWGYDSQQLMQTQHPYESMVYEEDCPSVFERLRELDISPRLEQDYRIIMKNGQTKWVYSYTKPVLNPEGHITHYDGYLLDITERRTIQQALHESETRLRLALDATNDVLWDLDLTSGNLYVSRKWTVLLECADEEIPATHEDVLALIHPEDRDLVTRMLADHIDGRSPSYETKYRLRLWGDEYKWVLDRGRVVERDDEGRARRMTGTYTDITQQKNVEIEVSLQRALLRSMINSIPDLIFYKDMKGIYMGCNPAFSEYVGKGWDDVVGKTDVDLFEPEQARQFSEIDRLMLLEKKPRIDEFWIDYPDGRRVLLSTLRTPYYGPSGEMLGVVGISRDITAHRQAEQELAEKQAQLVHSGRLAALGEMSTAITHELGQPLQIIRTSAGIIAEELGNPNMHTETVRTMVEKIINQIRRAATIVRNVRAFARQDSESPVATPIDLKFPFEDALSFFREQFKQHEIYLDVECEKDLPLVLINAQKFQQIVVNLLSNARYAVEEKKASAPPSYQKHIAVNLHRQLSAETDATHIVLTVSDNGAGMDAKAVERCMDPFYTTKPVGEGTGLGLAILYGIVKDSGGSVECESEPGQGTLFRVHLPTDTGETLQKGRTARRAPILPSDD